MRPLWNIRSPKSSKGPAISRPLICWGKDKQKDVMTQKKKKRPLFVFYHDVMLHHVPRSRTQHHHGHFVEGPRSGQLISNSQEDVVKALQLISPRRTMAIIKVHLTDGKNILITMLCLQDFWPCTASGYLLYYFNSL